MTTVEPAVDFLLSNGFSKKEVENVQNAWIKLRKNDESLSSTLTRLGYFRAPASRTLELMQKGFISYVDQFAIFNPDAVERLKIDALTISNSPLELNTLHGHIEQKDFRKEALAGNISTKFGESVRLPNKSTHYSKNNGSEYSKKSDPQKRSNDYFSYSEKTNDFIEMPQVGNILGRCLLTGVLGQGGFGTVFSALHTTLNIPVAVKVISCEGRLPEAVRQIIRREAQTLARLNHPNVVRILDFEDAEMPYFTMEFVEGPNLAELIKQAGTIRFDRAIEIVLEVISGLAAAWKMGFVHRDIKPGNILISKTGQAKLADLGLARVPGMDDELIKPDQNRPLGTCAYISPEQIQNGSNVDFRSDIYSLACTLYHVVMGELPFPGKTQREVIMKHLCVDPTNPHRIAPEKISEEAGSVFLKALQKDPAYRYDSYEEFASALIKVKNSKPVSQYDLSLKTKSEINLIMHGLENHIDEQTVNKESTKVESRSKILQWLFKERKK